MRCASPGTISANLVQRAEPHRGHLGPRDINVDQRYTLLHCAMGSSQAREVWSTRAASARVSHLSLQASPSRGGAVGCSLVGGGIFVLLHGLPENCIDLFEMVDAFTEFALLAHQHSIASLQFLKA